MSTQVCKTDLFASHRTKQGKEKDKSIIHLSLHCAWSYDKERMTAQVFLL